MKKELILSIFIFNIFLFVSCGQEPISEEVMIENPRNQQIKLEFDELKKMNEYEPYGRFIRKYQREKDSSLSHFVVLIHQCIMPLSKGKYRTLFHAIGKSFDLKTLSYDSNYNLQKQKKQIPEDIWNSHHIVLVPKKEWILFVQEAVQPGYLSESTKKPNLYMVYDYHRGSAVGRFGLTEDTQSIYISMALLIKENGGFKTTGVFIGKGSRGKSFNDLVKHAVGNLNFPDQIHNLLESIVGHLSWHFTKIEFDNYKGWELSEEMRFYLATHIVKNSLYWADQLHSLKAIARIGWRDKVDKIIPFILNIAEKTDRRFIRAVPELLYKIVDHKFIHLLLQILRGKNKIARDLVKDVISRKKDSWSLSSSLLGILKKSYQSDDDPRIRKIVLKIYNGLKVKSPIDKGKPVLEFFIKKLRESEDVQSRAKAAKLLGDFSRNEALLALIGAIEDESIEVRKNVAESLGDFNDKQAVIPLLRLLEDQDTGVRVNATIAFQRIVDERALKPLIGLLSEKNEGLRIEAAHALRKLNDKSAIEPLIEAMEQSKHKGAFSRALSSMTGKDYKENVSKWRKWLKKNKDKL